MNGIGIEPRNSLQFWTSARMRPSTSSHIYYINKRNVATFSYHLMKTNIIEMRRLWCPLIRIRGDTCNKLPFHLERSVAGLSVLIFNYICQPDLGTSWGGGYCLLLGYPVMREVVIPKIKITPKTKR